MTQCVLCTDKTFEEKYQREFYKYYRLYESTDLLGYAGIEVLIHEDYHMDTALGERLEDSLEERLTTLGEFGYCKVIFVDEDGNFSRLEPKQPKEIG